MRTLLLYCITQNRCIKNNWVYSQSADKSWHIIIAEDSTWKMKGRQQPIPLVWQSKHVYWNYYTIIWTILTIQIISAKGVQHWTCYEVALSCTYCYILLSLCYSVFKQNYHCETQETNCQKLQIWSSNQLTLLHTVHFTIQSSSNNLIIIFMIIAVT